MKQKTKENLWLILFGQALVAMLGSLFYSEYMGYIPCKFCWIQRILMYPLVIVYGIVLIKKDIRYGLAGLFLSGIGILVSTYHYLIQKVPALQSAGDSCGVVPCNTAYVNYFGFVTIPLMALVAFIVIFIVHIILIKADKGAK